MARWKLGGCRRCGGDEYEDSRGVWHCLQCGWIEGEWYGHNRSRVGVKVSGDKLSSQQRIKGCSEGMEGRKEADTIRRWDAEHEDVECVAVLDSVS